MTRALLPTQSTSIERALADAGAAVADIPVPIDQLWNPATCPEHILPWLAWALSVDVWDPQWPEAYRRQVLADAVEVHRRKGTVGAVRRALAGVGFRTDISEWFEHGGAPHTFRVEAFATDVARAELPSNISLVDLVTRKIETVKPARSHFVLLMGSNFQNRITVRSGLRLIQPIQMTLPAAVRPRTATARPVLRSKARITQRYSMTLAAQRRWVLNGAKWDDDGFWDDRARWSEA